VQAIAAHSIEGKEWSRNHGGSAGQAGNEGKATEVYVISLLNRKALSSFPALASTSAMVFGDTSLPSIEWAAMAAPGVQRQVGDTRASLCGMRFMTSASRKALHLSSSLSSGFSSSDSLMPGRQNVDRMKDRIRRCDYSQQGSTVGFC